jgi:hypothetical protein
MVNNFELIKNFVEFKNENDFFFLQILKRKRENPEMLTDSMNIDNFYIKSKEDFDKYEQRIIELCELNRARAYIRLNRRNYEDVAHETNCLIAEYLKNKDFRAISKSYLSACGKSHSEKTKKWILDIDADDLQYMEAVKEMLVELKSTLFLEVPTKNGIHFITSGFNPNIFKNNFPTIEIKEDQPTILYSI